MWVWSRGTRVAIDVSKEGDQGEGGLITPSLSSYAAISSTGGICNILDTTNCPNGHGATFCCRATLHAASRQPTCWATGKTPLVLRLRASQRRNAIAMANNPALDIGNLPAESRTSLSKQQRVSLPQRSHVPGMVARTRACVTVRWEASRFFFPIRAAFALRGALWRSFCSATLSYLDFFSLIQHRT